MADSSIHGADTLQTVCRGTFVKSWEYHESLPSTNDRALQLATKGHQPLPALILAGAQTRGRGRGPNRWWATSGAMTFSLLADPTVWGFPPARWPSLSLATAIAIGEVISELIPSAAVHWKWPNDVFLEGRKVCGILLEIASAQPRQMVIGIGINVNNPAVQTSQLAEDDELLHTAVSMSEIAGSLFFQTEVLQQVLHRLDLTLIQLTESAASLPQLWSRRSLLEGRHVTVSMGSRRVTGRARAVDQKGALEIETSMGLERCAGGIVTHFE